MSSPLAEPAASAAAPLQGCSEFAEACVSVLCCLVTQTTSRKKVSKPLPLSFKKVFGDDSSAGSLGSVSAAEGEGKVGFGGREQQKTAAVTPYLGNICPLLDTSRSTAMGSEQWGSVHRGYYCRTANRISPLQPLTIWS